MKIKIVFLLLPMLFLAQTVFAQSAILSAVPAFGDNLAGESFDISIKLETGGNKVCAIKGRINLVNLECEKITVEPEIIAQIEPTCSNPDFVLGIIRCSDVGQNLLTIKVKGKKAGQASLYFGENKIMGPGSDIVSASVAGIFDITSNSNNIVIEPNQTVQVERAEQELAIDDNQINIAEKSEITVENIQPTEKEGLLELSQKAAVSNLLPYRPIELAIIILFLIIGALIIWYFVKIFKNKKNQKIS